MNRSKILAELEDIVRDLFDEYQGPVTEDLSAHDVEQWDSLGNVQFVVLIEKTMDVRFSTEEMASLSNLGELMTLIERKKPV